MAHGNVLVDVVFENDEKRDDEQLSVNGWDAQTGEPGGVLLNEDIDGDADEIYRRYRNQPFERVFYPR
ncbi:MAG: hypothetical protein ABG776_04975 [Cyanobacteria bacterium J06555_13]